jgi:hypothetical protein
MTNFIYDPRPLDPPEYWETEMSDKIEWCATHTKIKFTRDGVNKKIDKKYGEGDLIQALQAIVDVYEDVAENYVIDVDASQLVSKSDRLTPICSSLKFTPRDFISWDITDKETGAQEVGTDAYELFDWIEYMMNENKRFSIDFDTIDPTPQFLWDDTGGECAVSAHESWTNSFNQKRALKS